MEVFVSHSFSDEDLAELLVTTLAASDIKGYMAQRKKEYELLIRDKIRAEISRSAYLIGIITKNSVCSPSVFEEIGFALGQGIPVIIMREERVISGVLTHGLETEDFERDTFKDVACVNIKNYLLRAGDHKKPDSRITSDAFLNKKRLTWEPEREEYGVNESTDALYDWITEEKAVANTYRHFVQFSACPKYLLDDIDLYSSDISRWIDDNRVVDVQGRHYDFLPGMMSEKIGLDSRSFHRYLGQNKLIRYLELYRNGFVQEGLSSRLIRSIERLDKPALHLCWTTGAFWTFLNFCKRYFIKLNVKDDIHIFCTVHSIKDLTLFGFGGKTEGGAYTEPYTVWYDNPPPESNLFNVALHDTIKADTLDSEIAKLVRRYSDRLSNAFSLPFSRCYNKDGTFNFELFDHYFNY